MERAIGGVLLSPARFHDVVWHLAGLGYSQRFACQIVGLSRSAYRRARTRASQPDKRVQLRERMHEFTRSHRRWGHRRAWRNALADGYGVCRETFRRLWREECLRVLPQKSVKGLTGAASVMFLSASTQAMCGLLISCSIQPGMVRQSKSVRSSMNTPSSPSLSR